MPVTEAIPAVWAGIFHFGSVLLEINASFYERVARLEVRLVRKLFLTSLRSPSLILSLQYSSVNLLFFFVSTSGSSSSSQEVVFLIPDV
jgi:hypothetical protein